MSGNTRDVTGGDVYSLWRVANITLPTVQKIYVDQANAAHKIDVPDDQKFGRCHPWWATVCAHLEQALFSTGVTISGATVALNGAIDDFTRVDGSNANALNEVGRELEEILNDPNLHDKADELTDDEKPGTFQAPNWEAPEGWYDND